MQATIEYNTRHAPRPATTLCYHCGTECISARINLDNKLFCCEGCKVIYEIINENGLCDYYKLEFHPGISQIKSVRNDKYAFLDDELIANKLYQFTDGKIAIVKLYIPGIHCSSCLWLLEHLSRIDQNIISSKVNFTAKEVTIHFSKNKLGLRQIAELLLHIGYEPYISLNDADNKKTKKYNKQRIYKLGIAGFCFGNIMMMSFPEYLSFTGIEKQYTHFFRYLNLILSLPVFFYAASEFFITAWKGLQRRNLNIDAPVALAITITFSRSIYEILSNTGAGYLDSMSGIVFFMLAGRVVQECTYKSISFDRDYKSYFPIAVDVVVDNSVRSTMLSDLKEKDVMLLHNDEIIPADAIVLKGNALIDYSFVTGESEAVPVKQNEIIYAGGKQVGQELTIELIKPVAGSYLTSLWGHYSFSHDKGDENEEKSFIHILSKYFTWILFGLALLTAVYWQIKDPSKIITSITSMLIVACPCALLLSSTFTNGNLLRIFSQNGLFMRDTTVIEQLGKITHIVFDKTGTITQNSNNKVSVSGHQLSEHEKDILLSVVRHSHHPASKAIAEWLGNRIACTVNKWKEIPGKGLEAWQEDIHILVGSAAFTGIDEERTGEDKATVYIRINDDITAIHFSPVFREAILQVITKLKSTFKLSLLSGDNDRHRQMAANIFGNKNELLFEQSPLDKLQYIETQQQKGEKIMMIGDGLNDAGALQQSNAGITLTDDINNFTPACDAILDAKKIRMLPAMLRLAKASRYIIITSFAVSIIYNIAGLYFATQGLLKPIVAAILMPCSTLSIVLITSGMGSLIAKWSGLSLKADQ